MNDILYYYDFVVVTVLRILFGVGRAPQRTYDDIAHAQLYNLVQHNLSCFARSCSKKANPNQRAAIVAFLFACTTFCLVSALLLLLFLLFLPRTLLPAPRFARHPCCTSSSPHANTLVFDYSRK